MPTRRGIAILALAAAFYVAARLFGTFELYLVAFCFALLVSLTWAWALLSAAAIAVAVHVGPSTAVAGERLELSVRVRNRAYVPVLGCRVTTSLAELGAGDLIVACPLVGPRHEWAEGRRSEPVWRGVYDLDPPQCLIHEPLGLVCLRVRLCDRVHVVVVPRIPQIRRLAGTAGLLLGSGGLRGGGGRGSEEFRSIRPHQPGEPLSRIHWPSTARTGLLMLRELEEAPRADCMIVLDGLRTAVVGRRPDDTFEKQVELVGALADAVLRQGRPVMVVIHGLEDEFLNLEPIPADRRRLLQALAGATAASVHPVGEAMAWAMAHGARASSVAVVSAAHDPGLIASLRHLARVRVGVLLVHVSASSYLDLPEPLDEETLFLVRLQQLGVPVLAVGRVEDVGAVLSSQGAIQVRGAPGELREAL